MELLLPHAANTSPLTPLGFLDRAATVYGDHPAIVYNSTTRTWADTRRRCLRLASSLVSHLKISPGHVVSVVAPNVPAMYEMHFAVPMSGAVLNNINTRLDASTVSVLLRHCSSKLVFVDALSLPLVHDALRLFPDPHPRPRVIPINDPDEEGRGKQEEEWNYEKLVEMGDPGFRWVRPKSEWDPMVINYTSGTTSAPKGVVHCHRGLFIITVDMLMSWGVPQNPVYLWTLPMFHANGWSFPWGMAAIGGTSVCLRRFDAAAVYHAIHAYKVTHLCCAPVVLSMLANAEETDRKPLPGKVEILTAGAPPAAAVLHRAEGLGFLISHGYGLTETAGLVVWCAWKGGWDGLPAGERARLKARQGVATPFTAAADVIDVATGKAVERDGKTMGEVVLRCGSLMLGYLNDEAATAKSMGSDGWFYTGDVGVMHPDGYMEIRDRKKDIIISGGENISSVEVESVLYTHPAVSEAAVVARPDDYWGETPCAFVALKKGSGVSEAEMIRYCRERMPSFMVPRTVAVVSEELPKTSTGKLQKFVLRDMAKKMGSLPGPRANL